MCCKWTFVCVARGEGFWNGSHEMRGTFSIREFRVCWCVVDTWMCSLNINDNRKQGTNCWWWSFDISNVWKVLIGRITQNNSPSMLPLKCALFSLLVACTTTDKCVLSDSLLLNHTQPPSLSFHSFVSGHKCCQWHKLRNKCNRPAQQMKSKLAGRSSVSN